jgi:hypothetical protein
MNCKELNIKLCDNCEIGLIKDYRKCITEYIYDYLNWISKDKKDKNYLLKYFEINNAEYANPIQLKAVIYRYFPQYISLFESFLLLM